MKKILALLTLLFVVTGSSVAAFAWWDNLEQTTNATIQIGEGSTLIVAETVSPPEGKTLVPSGVLMGVNDVDSVVFEYEVELDKVTLDTVSLTVVANNIQIGGSSVNANLVDISINADGVFTINNDVVEVIVTVTLNMPADEAEYNSIADEEITFDLVFTAA